MARYPRTVIAVCALLLTCLGAAAAWPSGAAPNAVPQAAAADAPATVPPNSITVSASGEVTVVPDMATVTFGVLLTRDTAQGAQAAANSVIAAAVRNLHALGIPDRRIQTVDIELQPQYDSAGNVTGYQASQTLSVVVYRLQQAGRVVDAGVAAGANNNVSIAFGLRDENAAHTAALKVAVGIAHARAAAAAAALGRSLVGAHVQLTENSQSQPRPVVQFGAVRAPAAGAPATQTFGGTLTVSEDVTLTYTFS
jgi:uncharacterized protein YggE